MPPYTDLWTAAPSNGIVGAVKCFREKPTPIIRMTFVSAGSKRRNHDSKTTVKKSKETHSRSTGQKLSKIRSCNEETELAHIQGETMTEEKLREQQHEVFLKARKQAGKWANGLTQETWFNIGWEASKAQNTSALKVYPKPYMFIS